MNMGFENEKFNKPKAGPEDAPVSVEGLEVGDLEKMTPTEAAMLEKIVQALRKRNPNSQPAANDEDIRKAA